MTGYFYHFFLAYDCPTVASVNPSFSAACIAAFRSWGFYDRTQACLVGLIPSRN